jgi:hypothetical protein
MRKFTALACACAVILCSVAAGPTSKPKLKVAGDGYPGGHDTPEGAACDLARAFIRRDDALFTQTCIQPYGGGKARADYESFLAKRVVEIKAEAAKKEPSPGGPKSIGKVFAARHLSNGGPASYGYAMFGFQDVMFVDVGVVLQDGHHYLNRTLVIKDKEGQWYAHPAPTIYPLLSGGLNDEPPSNEDFSEAYEIQK